MAKKKTRKKISLIDIIILLLILVGLGVLIYPFASDAYVSYQNQQLIDSYQAMETKKNSSALKAEYEKYKRRNVEIAKKNETPGVSAFNNAVNEQGTANVKAKRKQKTLNRETIAQLTIPKIKVSLPVFSKTTDWLLQFGACLLDGTSYPTGGKGTHAVISAHRGVPNAELFTRLPELKKGDKFYIKIGNKTLAYQVYKRQTILPSKVSELRVVPGKDIVTLMTCTPYMINSHRLLITGRRVPYTAKDNQDSKFSELWNKLKLYFWIVVALLLVGLLMLMGRSLTIGRRHYRLTAPAGATAMTAHRGRHEYIIKPDENGKLEKELSGGRYRVNVTMTGRPRRYKAYVKHMGDQDFTLKLRR